MSYLVVGRSIAGVAAALVLAEEVTDVHLLSYGTYESGNIEDWFLIGPTPINTAPITGIEFQRRASALMKQAGVRTNEPYGGPLIATRLDAGPGPGQLVLDGVASRL